MYMMKESRPPLPVHPLHEHAVLTSACLLKGFHLVTSLLFSSIIIPFPLPLWKCYKFHYRRPASPCLFTCTWVSNIQLLSLQKRHPETCCILADWLQEFTSNLGFEPWRRCNRSNAVPDVLAGLLSYLFTGFFLLLVFFLKQLNGLCFVFCILSGYL